MGVIFDQLGRLFLQSVPTVILVFLLYIILDRIFFRPLTAVMKKRDEETVGALTRAHEQAAAAEAKSREYEDTFQSVRQEVYRQREADRHQRVEQRDASLRNARERAEALIRDARAALEAEVARAKGELEAVSHPLAEEISQSLVGSGMAPGGQERSPL